ncbi:MAG TPA: acetylxylan esterase [Lacunisphaera sp.]|nr:acetylxylan esterase [Lacunisphaera sp.]
MRLLLVPLLSFLALRASASDTVSWVPANLPPLPSGANVGLGAYLKPEEGRAVLDAALARFPDQAAWTAYADHVRQRIQEGAGLSPWPRRTPLNPVSGARRVYAGYTVENVCFESVPGYWVTGNLYRPTDAKPPYAAVLSTHGHARPIVVPADYDNHARFSPDMQLRCATLARMGAVVLSIDMFAMGDSIQVFGQAAHRQSFAFTIQLWNAIRSVDFLLEQESVDPKRIGVTGASGGGTLAFMLTAVDPRIAVSVPVVMVSSYFFGGCPCESGRPVHRSADHFASNAMVAALAAPRPMLVVSDGKDWTQHNPEIEFPFLRRIYGYHDAAPNVANVHLAEEGHDYGPSKRDALYRFAATHLDLNLAAVLGPNDKIDESRVTVEKARALHVFTADFPIPAQALHDPAAVERVLQELQR